MDFGQISVFSRAQHTPPPHSSVGLSVFHWSALITNSSATQTDYSAFHTSSKYTSAPSTGKSDFLREEFLRGKNKVFLAGQCRVIRVTSRPNLDHLLKWNSWKILSINFESLVKWKSTFYLIYLKRSSKTLVCSFCYHYYCSLNSFLS